MLVLLKTWQELVFEVLFIKVMESLKSVEFFKWILSFTHHDGSKVWFFGLFKTCHYVRAVVWTPYNQNLRLGKYFIGILLRSWPHGPQGCPMGPKFLAQKISHIILRCCYFMHFGDLLWKNYSKSTKTVNSGIILMLYGK